MANTLAYKNSSKDSKLCLESSLRFSPNTALTSSKTSSCTTYMSTSSKTCSCTTYMSSLSTGGGVYFAHLSDLSLCSTILVVCVVKHFLSRSHMLLNMVITSAVMYAVDIRRHWNYNALLVIMEINEWSCLEAKSHDG